MRKQRIVNPYIFLWVLFFPFCASGATVSGTLQKWKPIQIDFYGPIHSENDFSPNPFLDYRLQVEFSHDGSGTVYNVPGFFAGDGGGGSSGNVWRVMFTPDQLGDWQYIASFSSGANVAISLDSFVGNSASFDGESGKFTITERSMNGSQFYRYGRLESIGHHYFKFRDGGFWIKSGLNSPENFLGFSGFDNSPYAGNSYAYHLQDWKPGDPDWDSPYTSASANDGRAIIGFLNYLSSQEINSIYFLPMNIGDDAKDTWPYASETINREGSSANDNLHFDISKMEQWETTFKHAQEKEIFLHFALNGTASENKNELDDGTLGIERKLFYRELIARFGHHNALQWNISEEYNLPLKDPFHPDTIKEFAQYIKDVDPYDHPITVHPHGNTYAESLAPFVGDDRFGAMSIQTWHQPDGVGVAIEHFRFETMLHGYPVPSSVDESVAINEMSFDDYRKRIIWDAFLSGGMQEMFYNESVLHYDDFRYFQELYAFYAIAKRFVETNLPFWEMETDDDLVFGEDLLYGGGEVFFKKGELYAVYLPTAEGMITLDLSEVAGDFEQRWFNPRTGLFQGSASTISGGATIPVGTPPHSKEEDWVLLYTKIESVLPVVSVPEISPPSGIYEKSATVTMLSKTPGAVIYYTLDGSDPDTGSLLYSEPFDVASDASVKARGYRNGYTESDIVTTNYIVTDSATNTGNSNEDDDGKGGGGGGCFVAVIVESL